jgi:hypothetical protein
MSKASFGAVLAFVLLGMACSHDDPAPVEPPAPAPVAPTQTYTPTPEPTWTYTPTPEPTTEPAPVEDHYVPLPNGGDDDHHKSRFCRRHWYC